MDSTKFKAIDEEALFEAEGREVLAPSRKHIVLREKLNSTGKQKLANQSRFGRRNSRGSQSNVPGPRRRQR
jgi:hypothetical protein